MQMSPFGGFGGAMFTIMPIIIGLGFIVVFGLIVFSVVRSARQWKRNNDSPVLTVEAVVVAKRADMSYYHNNAGSDNFSHTHSSSTTYYATFEFASGDRLELRVPDSQYGQLVERDFGRLTFQGTRYLGFERIKK